MLHFKSKRTVKIINETICTFVRTERPSSTNKKVWHEFPATIEPKSEVTVAIHEAKSKDQEEYDEVDYSVFDNAKLLLAKFMFLVEDTDEENTDKVIKVEWESLPKVFGVQVSPNDGHLKFDEKGIVEILITGNVLEGGPRSTNDNMKLTDWKSWQDLQPECEIGDVIAVNRGAYRHYGVVQKIDLSDGKVIISNLSGTAHDLIDKYGIEGGVEQVGKALTSHGDIAKVQEVSLEDFTGGTDQCRVENLHDDTWKAYLVDIILNRITQATGVSDYSITEFNCEHYANLIRYGMPYSAQIEELKKKFDISERGKEFFESEIKRLKQAKSDLVDEFENAKKDLDDHATKIKQEIRQETEKAKTTINDEVELAKEKLDDAKTHEERKKNKQSDSGSRFSKFVCCK